jgi:hypothetical protein
MCGDEPSHVPDEVIAEIRARERNGAIELLTLNRRRLRFQLQIYGLCLSCSELRRSSCPGCR